MSETILWQELLNCALIPIHPKMFNHPGMIIEKKCQLKGQSPRQYPPELRYVLLNSDFIKDRVNKFLEYFIDPEISTETHRLLLLTIIAEALSLDILTLGIQQHNSNTNDDGLTYSQLIEEKLFSHRKLRTMKNTGDRAIDVNGDLWERKDINNSENKKAKVIYQLVGKLK